MHYHANLKCSNCDNTEYVDIPKGVSIRDFTRTHCCLNCGCAEMSEHKDTGPRWDPGEYFFKERRNDSKFLCKAVVDNSVVKG